MMANRQKRQIRAVPQGEVVTLDDMRALVRQADFEDFRGDSVLKVVRDEAFGKTFMCFEEES